jgi:hypothetical protein
MYPQVKQFETRRIEIEAQLGRFGARRAAAGRWLGRVAGQRATVATGEVHRSSGRLEQLRESPCAPS